MKPQSTVYIEQLGAAVAQALEPNYVFAKSRASLSTVAGPGTNLIRLVAMTQHSPGIMLYLLLGRAFDAAAPFRALLGIETPYDILQNTRNLRHMRGLDYQGRTEWLLDIREPVTDRLVSEITETITGIAEPFFVRFASIEEARDAIAESDGWCLGGWSAWPGLLCLDASMGDLEHFERWCAEVVIERERPRAIAALDTVRAHIRGLA